MIKETHQALTTWIELMNSMEATKRLFERFQKQTFEPHELPSQLQYLFRESSVVRGNFEFFVDTYPLLCNVLGGIGEMRRIAKEALEELSKKPAETVQREDLGDERQAQN